MNQTLIDNSLIVLSILGAIAIAKYSKKRQASFVFSFFIIFPPLLVFLNMWAHTIAVLVLNVQRWLAGTFRFTFLFYSQILFGLVFIFLSGITIHYSRKRMEGDEKQFRTILLLNAITAVLFLPVGFLNPIGFLPVIAAVLSTITLLIGRGLKKKMNPEQPSISVSNL